jgi:AcrR family transcriptional regulator
MARMPQDRRQVILRAAAGLFARKGIVATTVREIADEVGILSGSLYHHFESKEAIADEILTAFLHDLRDQCKAVLVGDADPRARLRDLVVTSFDVVERHRDATAIYQNDGGYLGQFERFSYLRSAGREVQAYWLEVIGAGIAKGTFRRDLDPKVAYRLMRDAMWMSVRWFTPTRDYPISRLAEDCTALFLDGLARSA